MRPHVPRRVAVLAVAALAAVSLAACGASSPTPTYTVPDNVTHLMGTPVGRALAAPDLGYTPVANIYGAKHKVVGVIYANCGQSTVNLTQCAGNLDRQATMQHPNVYVANDGKIIKIQGPHVSTLSSLNYWVVLPASHQDFAKLSKAVQRGLIGIMPQIQTAIPQPGLNNGKHVKVLVKVAGGRVEVTAWVS